MDTQIKTALKWTFEVILGYVVVTLLGKVSDLIMGMVSIQGIVGILAIIGATALGVYWIVGWRRKSTTLSPRMIHLTIHYCQKRDTPNTESPARPRFVTNNRTNSAYWVSDLLEPYVKRNEICWTSHDTETNLRKYFKELKINVVERNPLPEELGLRFLKDGALLSAEEMAKADELVKKLQGRRLDDLRVVCLYPWYCRLFRSLQGTSVPRRLLIKYSEKKAFEPPLHDLELIENEILDRQNYATRPFESCEKWSKRRGYNFTAKRYTEDELVGEASRNLQEKVSP